MAKLNSLGYKTDQKGILRRYYRERQNWESHLQESKEFILKQTRDFSTGKIAILGSGWLLDIPIIELQSRFSEIWLFDIHHPRMIRQKYSGFPNIKFINVDLTNDLSGKALQAKSFSDFEDQLLKHEKYKLPTMFDFVVSVNLLNQLDIILCDYLKRKFNQSDRNLEAIRQIVQQQHIELIKENNGCLISDCIELSIGNDDEVVQQKSLIYANLLEEKIQQSWIWIFDTQKNYHQKCNTNFKVNAYCF